MRHEVAKRMRKMYLALNVALSARVRSIYKYLTVNKLKYLFVVAGLVGGMVFHPGFADENDLDVTRIAFSALPGWQKEEVSSFLPSLLAQCHFLEQNPQDRQLGGAPFFAKRAGYVAYWQGVCRALRAVPLQNEAASRQFIEQWFTPYHISSDEEGLMTGYFEPEIKGSLYKSAAYPIPVYGRPPELKTIKTEDGSVQNGFVQNGQFVPYYTRAQINQGELAGRQLELAWVADPVELFFLQIQGSGRIRLEDGRIMHVAYAGKNGQPYVPIGHVLVEQGSLTEATVSMQSINAWLHDHPDQANSLMELNPNYVFFRVLSQSDNTGSPGALGIGLVPGRSAAIDQRYIPLASVVWLNGKVPSPRTGHLSRWHHLALAHDVGADITGPQRVDLFMGWGKWAAWQAGYMHAPVKMYVLVPRQPAHSSP